jgi:hypothetical protein
MEEGEAHPPPTHPPFKKKKKVWGNLGPPLDPSILHCNSEKSHQIWLCRIIQCFGEGGILQIKMC